MQREHFLHLVGMLRNHPVFHTGRKKKQAPPEWQLMVFLFYLGKPNNGASNPTICSMFGIDRGTAELYKKRSITAI